MFTLHRIKSVLLRMLSGTAITMAIMIIIQLISPEVVLNVLPIYLLSRWI